MKNWMNINNIHQYPEDLLQSELKLFVKQYEHDLLSFIWYYDKAKFTIDAEENTFYFRPKDKVVWIPLDWFLRYISDKDNPKHLSTAKIGLTHEFSRFRDMLREKISTGKSSMYDALKNLNSKKIPLADGKTLPIGEKIHTFYNCIDDIIINEEVMKFLPFELGKKDFQDDYQQDAFPDYNADGTLNTTDPVDYTKRPYHIALPYYFLRNGMVPDQEILLDPALRALFFSPQNGKKISWRKSYEQLLALLESTIHTAENTSDPKQQANYSQLKSALIAQKVKLKNLISNPQMQQALISQVWTKIGEYYDISKVNPMMLSLYDLIYSLAVSQGKEYNHQLCVMPSLRYRVYEKIFEPLLETLILLDALKGNLQKWTDKKRNWEKNWEKKRISPLSGKGTYERSLEEHIKELENIIDYQKLKELQEKLNEEKKQTELKLSSLTEHFGISDADAHFTEQVKKNFSIYTTAILDILYKELAAIDVQLQTEYHASKKWKLNYDAFMDEFPTSFVDGDFSQKPIYERCEFTEALEQDFKKLLFYFVLDVSGSTEAFRWDDGLMNGIMTSLTIALKNVEKKIQMMLADPGYKIPVKFVIYTDKVVYSSTEQNLDDKPYEIELIKANKLLNTISWGTNDVQWWRQISQCLLSDLEWDEDYLMEIKKGERKSVVLQISDSDVTDYGLQYLKTHIEKAFWSDVVNNLMAKRIILWETINRTYTEAELKRWGLRSDEYVKDHNGQEIIKDGKKLITVKEVGVRSKNEIIKQIAKIFENFFADIPIKKSL